MRTVQLKITQEAIDNADRGECKTCAVAWAIDDHLSENHKVEVISFHEEIQILNLETGEEFVTWIPPDLLAWIVRFDTRGRGAVQPQTFTIGVPDALEWMDLTNSEYANA